MRVLLFPNTSRDIDLVVTLQAAYILYARSCEVFLPDKEYDVNIPDYIGRVPAGSDFSGYDMIVPLGGDGTILSVSAIAAKHDIPILGINLGRLGFMTELERDELNLLDRVAKGDYSIQKRMRLSAKVERKNKTVFSGDALNDAVVSKGEISRMIPVSIDSDGSVISKLICDGVVIATPTGSTAYSMSAGGPIVEPVTRNFVITPICAHAYYAGSFVLSSQRHIRISLGNLENRAAYLSMDGAESFHLESFDNVCVQISKYHTELVILKDNSFYDILKNKLSNV